MNQYHCIRPSPGKKCLIDHPSTPKKIALKYQSFPTRADNKDSIDFGVKRHSKKRGEGVFLF